MSRTDCLKPEELAAFHLGELPPRQLEELAAHMEGCVECETAARQLDSVSTPLLDAYRRSAQSGQLTDSLTVPQQVGEYEILEEVGRGGMGVVFRARHRRLQRVVALKMLVGGSFALPDEVIRFRTEAEAVARLQHPHIVQIYEIGEQETEMGVSRPYFTLEFVEGGSLAARVAGRPQPAGLAAGWIETLARATHYAHGQGIIHRDLKPSNVLLTTDGQPKICDFGVAKLLANSELKTQSGMLVGTAEYMAPEQATGNTPGPAVDIYALGAILYTLLTGRPPFQGVSPLNTLEQVRLQEPVTPGRLQPLIPRDLETICLKCLEKEPAKRYATALELADDLRQFLCDEPIQARRPTPWEQAARWVRRHKAFTLALAAVLLSMAAATAFSTYWAMQKETERVRARNAESEAVAARNAAREERDRVARNLYVARTYLVGQALDTPAGLAQVARLFSDWRGRELRSDPRGWEWYYFQTLANRSEHTLHGHALDVTSLAWNPDGSTLASGSLDQTIRLWDAATGRQLASLKNDAGILALSWRADGQRLASADYPTRTVTIWDPKSGERLRTLRGHAADVWWVAWSPDNRHLASIDASGAVFVWDESRGTPERKFTGAGGSNGCLCWSPDGRRLAAADSGKSVTIYELVTGKVLRRLSDHPSGVAGVVWSPEGKRLATLVPDHGAFIWDPDSGKQLQMLAVAQPEGFPGSIHWSPDGSRLAISRLDLAIVVWNLVSGQQEVLRGHSGSHISTVCWSPDGRRLASAERGWNGTIKIWSATAGSGLPSFGEAASALVDTAWSADSRWLATGHADGTIRIWDAATQRRIATLSCAEGIHKLGWSPNGKLLAGGGAKGAIYLWDPTSGRLVKSRPGDGLAVVSLSWSRDSSRLGIGSEKSRFVTWEPASGTEFPIVHAGIDGVLRPQGDRVAAGESYGVNIFDLQGVQLLSWRNSEVTDNDPHWNQDGSRIATRSDFAVEVRDAETGRMPFPPLTHSRRVVRFVWSPDGKQMMTSTEDHDVHVWDVVEGNLVLSLHGPADPIVSLAWSPDSTRIAAATKAGTISLWDATSGYARERAPALLEVLNTRIGNEPQDLEALRMRAGVYARAGDWDEAAIDAKELTTASKAGWFQAGWWLVDAGPDGGPVDATRDAFVAVADSSAPTLRWYVSADDPNGFVPVQTSRSTFVTRLYVPQSETLAAEVASASGLDTRLWLNGEPVEGGPTVKLALSEGWNTLAVRVEERSPALNVLLRHGSGFYVKLHLPEERD